MDASRFVRSVSAPNHVERKVSFGAESDVKTLACFDWDCTLAVVECASPTATTNWLASFGGQDRLFMVKRMLDRLVRAGVGCYIVSRNTGEHLEHGLRALHLDGYFRCPSTGQLRMIARHSVREPLYNKGGAMLRLLHEKFPCVTRCLFIDDDQQNCTDVQQALQGKVPICGSLHCSKQGLSAQQCEDIVQWCTDPTGAATVFKLSSLPCPSAWSPAPFTAMAQSSVLAPNGSRTTLQSSVLIPKGPSPLAVVQSHPSPVGKLASWQPAKFHAACGGA